MTEEASSKRLIELIQWPIVAIIFIGCLTVFSLVFWGHQKLDDISTFISAVALVATAFYIRQVKQDTNGNLTRRDEQIADLQRQLSALHNVRTIETAQLAQQVPSSASLPPTLAPDMHANGSDAFTQATVPVPTIQRT